MFAIKVQDLYWVDHSIVQDGRCWSHTLFSTDVTRARTWNDRFIPDRIVAYWNVVHYERTETVAGKTTTVYSAIGGIRVLKQAIVVEV